MITPAIPLLWVYTFTAPSAVFYAGANLLQNHIHSPEHFLPAHGLCAPEMRVERVHPLEVHAEGAYQSISMEYTTPIEGRMLARICTDHKDRSHFFLFDEEGTQTAFGHLSVFHHDALVTEANSRLLTQLHASDLDLDIAGLRRLNGSSVTLCVEATFFLAPFLPLRAPYALKKQPKEIELLLLAEAGSPERQPELRAYRSNLLLTRRPIWPSA